MSEWLREPGFAGTHATLGADLSQLMATFFTALFILGWIQAKKRKADGHHWLMLGGMVTMVAFFTSYYLFRKLGVLAFEGKEGFGGPESLYYNVFVPILTFHIFLVILGLVMAIYMIVLGFRAQMFVEGKRILKEGVLDLTWGRVIKVLGILTGVIIALCLLLAMFGWLTPIRVIVGIVFLIIFFFVQITELGILQRIWPDGSRRHRVLGRFTMAIYCVLFITGSATYVMLYILYPGKIG